MAVGTQSFPSASRFEPPDLEALAARILTGNGVAAEDAAVVAKSLVRADLRGQPSHGLLRLETYVKRVQAGLTSRVSEASLVLETPALAVFDGGAGFGHVIGLKVMDWCVERAAQTGIAAATVRNSTHFGIAATFALHAAAAGMIGVAASNGAARMPPVGTRTAVLGTNPLAVAIPRSAGDAILLDMATSATALGKILVARGRGDRIPEGWAITKAGEPTTDPSEALAGLLLPMAGPKGFGLALVLEVLSACLSGAPPGRGAGSVMNTWDRPEGLGHFFLAIAPKTFGGETAFYASVDELAAQVHGAEPASEGARGLLPGEIEARAEAEGSRNGIPLPAMTVESLRRLADAAGVACGL